ncbi:MAG TPA: hypothetical protein VM166_09435 [Gemmatimonadaceae bacterium]|nr:hypothetical protein [Gemmatimonadaceae bacterium]
MSASPQPRDWSRAIRQARKEIRLVHPGRIGGAVAIAALNILWQGHGVLRAWPTPVRFLAVATLIYVLTGVAEFLWLVFAPAPPPSIAERLAQIETPPAPDPPDPLIETLKEIPPSVLKEGTLQLAEEMRSFEAGTDMEFVNSLQYTPATEGASEAQLEAAIEKQSIELVQRHLLTWRAYRERFYVPARAFRDELRKRLGIRNTSREPQIPALDDAVLTGANPISDAADYLVALARRLK